MSDQHHFEHKSRSGKSGLALLASLKLSKRDKLAWWALLAAGVVLLAGYLLRG